MMRYAADLAASGHESTANWITGKHEGWQPDEAAQEDIDDINSADGIISFTEELKTLTDSRGGRHVEFGYGLALGKRMIIVGWRENVFHHLPGVEFYETWEEALKKI